MLLFKNKLDPNLKYYLSKKIYKKYRILIKYKKFQSSIIKKINSFKGTVYHIIESINIICAQLSSKSIELLIEYPEIEMIYLDEYLFLCEASTSAVNKSKTFINNSKLTGNGVGIALIDSGIYPHIDLIKSTNKIKLFVDLINNYHHPYDDNGHGTCIAGILCGNSTESKSTYKSICPNSKLFCYKAFDKLGKGLVSDIIFAINEIINISKENNIKILCLPFEMLSNNNYIISLFDSILNIAVSNGLIPIIPSGTVTNNNSILGISLLKNVLTVGGIDTSSLNIKEYEFSSCGNLNNMIKPNLVANCTNIISLNCDTNYISEKNGLKLYPHKLKTSYKSFSGTSIAAAYICGICSLICEKKSNANFHDIISLLKVSCNTIDNIPKDYQGFGIIDINKLML